MNKKDLLREEAKRIYKKESKKVPKKQRMPFSEFWKKFKAMKKNAIPVKEEEEDFNLDEFISDVGEDNE